MGKVTRNRRNAAAEYKSIKRNKSLPEQIINESEVQPGSRKKERARKDNDDKYVQASLSNKIIQQARQQQEELEEELGLSSRPSRSAPFAGRLLRQNDSDEDSDSSEEHVSTSRDYDAAAIEINEEDERALEAFMSQTASVRRTLADIINEKITEKATEIRTQLSDDNSMQLQQVDEHVSEMYCGVRDILSKYRSGKLPKAFKIIPSLANWEQILALTEPEKWSAAAMYQATRIFASNLNAKMAQRFFNLILLPRIRDDIECYKRLNFHLYQALCKSLFKPAAFFKGILLPLAEAGNCSLREALIVASILAKNSIPMLHSAAAILKIAEMDYSGANSIFLKTLFDKKYALPYRVIDAVVHHYIRFKNDKRALPVLWHQSLLSFVQRYKTDISVEQKEALSELLHNQSHSLITPEIRRELLHSKTRDQDSEKMSDEEIDQFKM